MTNEGEVYFAPYGGGTLASKKQGLMNKTNAECLSLAESFT